MISLRKIMFLCLIAISGKALTMKKEEAEFIFHEGTLYVDSENTKPIAAIKFHATENKINVSLVNSGEYKSMVESKDSQFKIQLMDDNTEATCIMHCNKEEKQIMDAAKNNNLQFPIFKKFITN